MLNYKHYHFLGLKPYGPFYSQHTNPVFSLLDVHDSFFHRSRFHKKLHSMNVLCHFILIDVDSSQSFSFPNNGKNLSFVVSTVNHLLAVY